MKTPSKSPARVPAPAKGPALAKVPAPARVLAWNPLRVMDELLNVGAPLSWRSLPRLAAALASDGGWTPAADISETEKEYVIKADLPGVKKEDVGISLRNGLIVLTGERKEEKEVKGENQIRVERFHGTFSRSFSLPDDIDESGIKAEGENGTISIRIPKKKGTRPQATRIPVK